MADEKIRERARAHAERAVVVSPGAAGGGEIVVGHPGSWSLIYVAPRGGSYTRERIVGVLADILRVALAEQAAERPDAAALAAAREEGAKAERERIAAEVEAQALDHQGRAGGLFALLDTLVGSGG